MLDIPHNPAPHCCRRSELEQWARSEAKSDAMVGDVLLDAGVVEEPGVCGARQRWVLWTAAIVVVAAVLTAVGATIVFGLRSAADGDVPRSALDLPPRWAPFRP